MLGYAVRPAKGEAGYLLARYSYMGEIYIFTTDGLLLTTLGADARQAPFWPYAEQKIGMDITNLSFDAEHFWPSMFALDDGGVYLAAGKWHTSIARLEGLESVRRIDLGSLRITKESIDAAAPLRAKSASMSVLREGVQVHTIQAYSRDGFAQWDKNDWAPINKHNSFQLGRDGDKLVIGYRTNEPDLLRNAAVEYPFAFTQGGGLDLMLRTSENASRWAAVGDIRLFVTRRNGKLLAVLYRQKNAGIGKRQTFASPVHEVTFDDIEEVSNDVQLLSSGGNYQVIVPFSVLGLENPAGKTFRGDVGLVLSDGIRARARIYWHNKWDSMTADVPSEASLNPPQWGQIQF
jgi:hypothetical protein